MVSWIKKALVFIICLTIIFIATAGHWNFRGKSQNTRSVSVMKTQLRPARSNLQHEHSVKNQRRVLLFTYMRSGSTMIGDLLQNHTDSFYSFEPLRFVQEDVHRGRTVLFLNGTRRFYSKDNIDWLYTDLIYRWYTCDIERINVRDLTGILIMTFPITLRSYARCLENTKTSSLSEIQRIKKCKHLFLNPCETGKVLIVKTIRIKMTSVELLMKWLPGLKVVYLLRDPRGKLTSEIKTLQNKNPDLFEFESLARKKCMMYKSDIIMAERLRENLNKSISYLLYENFATAPLLTSKRLYKFLNMTYTNATDAFVKKTALSPVGREGCQYCTKSTNAKIQSYQWRILIQLTHAQIIDEHCSDVYRIVGYTKIETYQQLRDMSFPLLTRTNVLQGIL